MTNMAGEPSDEESVDVAQMLDGNPPFTRMELRTAMGVLEVARDLADEATGEMPSARASDLNQAHYTLQLMESELDAAMTEGLPEHGRSSLTVDDIVRCTEAAPYFAAGYDLDEAVWMEDGTLQMMWWDPESR